MGSFLSMLSWRLVQHLESDTPTLFRALTIDRSRCTHCQKPLSPSSLIPLASWLFNRGKAQCCNQPISIRYPLIELFTAIASIAVAWQYNTIDGWLGLSLQGWLLLLFTWSLISLSIIDLEHQLLPDRITLPLLWLGLLINTGPYGLTTLKDAVWGAALGYSILWLIFQGHRALTGKEGMGYGDFKLLAALGAWLGISALIPIMITAGLLAILVMGSLILLKKHDTAQLFPFGPWLAFAGWLVMMQWIPIDRLSTW